MIVNNKGADVNLLYGINKDGEPNRTPGVPVVFDESIYTFLKSEDVSVPGCEPLKFLSALREYQRI
jgi:hypothetical protein